MPYISISASPTVEFPLATLDTVKRTKVDDFPDLPKEIVVPVLLIVLTLELDPSENVRRPACMPDDVP